MSHKLPTLWAEKDSSTEKVLFMAATILLPKADLQDYVAVLYIYMDVE